MEILYYKNCILLGAFCATWKAVFSDKTGLSKCFSDCVIHAFKNSYGGGIKAHCFRKSFVLKWFVLNIIMFWFFKKKVSLHPNLPKHPQKPQSSAQGDQTS